MIKRLGNLSFSTLLLMLSVSVLAHLGCTRKNSDRSSIRIDLPSSDQDTLSGSGTFFIAINITGPGMAPILKNWESDFNSAATPPAEFQVEVPKGDNRLFQYLAVSRDSATGMLTFKYGDASKSLAAAQETVIISPAVISSGAAESEISGRLVDSSNKGLTGKVAMKYKPPGDKPTMTLFYENIFGGWFNSFVVLEGANAAVNYVMERPGTSDLPLFVGLTASSPEIQPSQMVAKVQIPGGYRMFGGGSEPPEVEPPTNIFFGFFGSPSGTKKACYEETYETIPYLYEDALGAVSISWNGFSSPPAANEAGIISGGDSACSGLDPFTEALHFNHLDHANRYSAGFEGPYKRMDAPNSHNPFLNSSYDSASQTLTLNWDYLPGIFDTGVVNGETLNPIAGSAVFYNVNFQDGQDGLLHGGGPDDFNCADLSNMGFSQVKTLGAAQKTVDIFGVTKTALEQERVKVVICPYRGSEYFARGLESHGFHHLLQPQPVFKIVGGDLSNSDAYANNYLYEGLNLRKTHTMTMHNILIPAVGDQLLSTSDVSSMQFSVNGGDWTAFSAGPNPSVSISSGWTPGVAMNDANLAGAVTLSSNETVQFKFTFTNPNDFGLTGSDYISPVITLVGSGVCSSPALKVKSDTYGTTYDNATFLDDVITNGTSHKDTYHLSWEGAGCSNVKAPIDYIQIFGNQPCLNHGSDISFDKDKAFSFRVDPQDLLGADCDFGAYGGVTIAVVSPSNVGSERVERYLGGGVTLTHSTTFETMPALLDSGASASPPSTKRLQILKWISGGVGTLTGQFFKGNDDTRMIDTGSGGQVANGSVSWNVAGNHFASPGSGVNPNFILNANAANTPGLDHKAYFQSATSGGVTGGFLTVVHDQINEEIVYVSKQRFWGFSPLFVTRSGAGPYDYKIHFMDSSHGNFEGRNIVTLSHSNLSNISSDQVYAFPINGGTSGDHEMLGVLVDSNVYFVAVKHQDKSHYWSSAVALSGAVDPLGAFFSYSNNQVHAFAATSTPDLAIYSFSTPFFDESANSWSAMPGSPASPASNHMTSYTPFHMSTCGEYYAVFGREGAGSGAYAVIQDDGSFWIQATSGAGFINTSYDRGACMKFTSSGSIPMFLSIFYSSSANSDTVIPMALAKNTSGGTACGIGGSGIANVPTPTGLQSSTGPLRGVDVVTRLTPTGIRHSFIAGVSGASDINYYEFGEVDCTNSNTAPTFETPTYIGALGSQSHIKSIQVMEPMSGGPGSSPNQIHPSLWIYGSNGNAIELRNQ